MKRMTAVTVLSFAVILAATLSALQMAGPLGRWRMEDVAVLLLCGLWVAVFTTIGASAILSFSEKLRERDLEVAHLQRVVGQAERENNHFWANFSHELRTPLNSILGYTELLLDSDQVRAEPAVLSDVERVNGAGRELLTLVNNVLAVSSYSADWILSRDTFRIDDLTGHFLAAIEPFAVMNGNQIKGNIESLDSRIVADLRRLERLLLSLMSGAIESAGEGAIEVNVSINRSGPQLEAGVSGESIRMKGDKVYLLTKPVDETSDEEHARLRYQALSLAVSKALVHELGGRIEVISDRDNKTTLAVSIPIELAGADAQDSFINRARTPNILVIDESDDSAELVSRYLKAFSYKVTITNDGADGKEIATLLQPDLIVLDVDMRNIDGRAVLQHLKFDSRTRQIPVVVITIDDAGNAARIGAAEVLAKPISSVAIQGAIARAGLQAHALTGQG